MADLGPVPWPPTPIRTERLVLRESEARTIDRREAGRAGSVPAGVLELGYLFLPQAWGHGYAGEACAAALDWCAGALPSERVVVCTQTANEPSLRLAAKLGFTEVERLEEFGAEQWLGEWSPAGDPSG